MLEQEKVTQQTVLGWEKSCVWIIRCQQEYLRLGQSPSHVLLQTPTHVSVYRNTVDKIYRSDPNGSLGPSPGTQYPMPLIQP